MWWIVLVVFLVLAIIACVALYIYNSKGNHLFHHSHKEDPKKSEQPRPIVRDEVQAEPVLQKTEPVKEETKKKVETKEVLAESDTNKNNSYLDSIKNMSPEMKAIVFADIFNKKHFK